jgi:hypothetical protein
MNRDIFRRNVRYTHRFGSLEQRADPLGTETFQPKFPERPDELRSAPITVQQFGERMTYPPRSAICKPSGGLASLSGPAPDLAQDVANPVPASTRKRFR